MANYREMDGYRKMDGSGERWVAKEGDGWLG